MFESIRRSAKAVEAVAEALMRDELGELTDAELVEVIQDYLVAQTNLEQARTTLGLLPPPGWPGA